MHPVIRVALIVLIAAAPMAAGAQAVKSRGVIEDELMPHNGQPLLREERGAGRVRPEPVPSAGNAVQPAASSVPPGANPAPAPAPPASDLVVQFANGSAALTPEGIAQIEELAHALSGPRLASYRFRIEGHTDTVGSADYNQALSDQRAAAVLDYLVHHDAIAASRLEAVGYGKTHLLVPTGDQVPEPGNRRVRIVNIGH
jgi:outer membrane protein OmpA-like peptidoglycan-associated protein